MKKGKNDVHKYMLKIVAVQPANEGTYTCTVTFQDDSEKEMETVLSFIGMNCFEYCFFSLLDLAITFHIPYFNGHAHRLTIINMT